MGYKGTRKSDDPGGSIMAMATSDHYTLISADTHAGANHETYREYLAEEYVADFDAWREKYKNPWKDLPRHEPPRAQLGRRAPQRRPGAGRRRRRGDLPQHRAAVLPELRAVRAAGEGRRLRAPSRRHPGAQPVDGRLLLAVPRAARRHRPDLPQRHRRRDRRREVDQGARPARRRAAPEHPARREVGEAALPPRLRPAVGGAAGPRDPGERARRHRLTRLRPLRVGAR